MVRRIVLFDLMGTLLDEASDYESLDQMMTNVKERHGFDVAAEELSGEFTLAFMELMRAEVPEGAEEAVEPTQQEPAEFLPFHEVAQEIYAGLAVHHGHVPTPEDRDWFWRTYRETQRTTWRAYPEAAAALRGLQRDGWLIGVVTDADRYLVDDAMMAMGFDDLVDVTVSAEEVGFVKPHHRMFETVLERTGASKDDAVMVGDSYERDILGARLAGIGAGILVDRHDARDVDVPRVRSLRALPALLRTLKASA